MRRCQSVGGETGRLQAVMRALKGESHLGGNRGSVLSTLYCLKFLGAFLTSYALRQSLRSRELSRRNVSVTLFAYFNLP